MTTETVNLVLEILGYLCIGLLVAMCLAAVAFVLFVVLSPIPEGFRDALKEKNAVRILSVLLLPLGFLVSAVSNAIRSFADFLRSLGKKAKRKRRRKGRAADKGKSEGDADAAKDEPPERPSPAGEADEKITPPPS